MTLTSERNAGHLDDERQRRRQESWEQYPALMAYITDRSDRFRRSAEWCDKLREDEEGARNGALGDVVADLNRAQADYAAREVAAGRTGYQYNAAMGQFLGLLLNGAHEPAHGYYMAGKVRDFFELGAATREATKLIAEGRTLLVIAAKSRRTGKACRFAKFRGSDQIKIVGNTVQASNGTREFHLNSNWSTQTCLVNVVRALSTGEPFNAAP